MALVNKLYFFPISSFNFSSFSSCLLPMYTPLILSWSKVSSSFMSSSFSLAIYLSNNLASCILNFLTGMRTDWFNTYPPYGPIIVSIYIPAFSKSSLYTLIILSETSSLFDNSLILYFLPDCKSCNIVNTLDILDIKPPTSIIS